MPSARPAIDDKNLTRNTEGSFCGSGANPVKMVKKPIGPKFAGNSLCVPDGFVVK
jgi:hypothetical protein